MHRSARTTTALPGFEAPAAGFEQPFELLAACHERVRCSLGLLDRLIVHIDHYGHDANARSAASDVLRYFDLAAPLHHQDEELHVFPLLAGGLDAGLAATVAELHADHARMQTLWDGLRTTLCAWARPCATGVIDSAARHQAAEFARLSLAHVQTEERVVFPAARARIDAPRLARMSAEMQGRRRAAAAL
ncbi:MAG: hemerythrin domain-containing protein [Burkholderiales bacterium]|nr:hemerythrin domain-containing protein [Burkholderiales bacterium]